MTVDVPCTAGSIKTGGKVCLVHNAASHESDSAKSFNEAVMLSSFQLSILSPGAITNKILPKMAQVPFQSLQLGHPDLILSFSSRHETIPWDRYA
jgi:short-subunit dehydrogenase